MAKLKLKPGRINNRGVGYVETIVDAHTLLEVARARALSSKPKELRIVISDEIAPGDAPEIVGILKIGGYADRDADQVFTKAVAKSPLEKELPIAVLNPRVLFFKKRALKKLNERYNNAFKSREAARLRLKSIHAELNIVEAETGATNSKIFHLQRNKRTTLLIRAAAKSPPLHIPQGITPDELRPHYAFLIDPLFLEVNPPVLRPAADIAEGILELRTSLGLPPAGGQKEVSDLLASLRAELATLIRRLVRVDLDKGVLLQEVDMEETSINKLNDMLPQIRSLMRSQSVYGAEGLDEGGRRGGQAPPPGGAAAGPGGDGAAATGPGGDIASAGPGGDVDGAAGGLGGAVGGAPAPNVVCT